MKVKAKSPDDDRWYPGVVDGANDDGTFTVKWDDPEGGPETNDLTASDMKEIVIFKDYVVGDDVEAQAPGEDTWYPGSVTKVNADGSFQVTWDDPDGGPVTADVQPDVMKKITVFKDYKVDDEVEAVFPGDGNMYLAKVVKANSDGTFDVAWDDADGGAEVSTIKAKEMKYPPIPFDKLEVGQKYAGVVSGIASFGAFVNFGADTDGLVHISKITGEQIENIGDHLEEGQEVEVWVSSLRDDGKVALSMVESLIGSAGAPRGPVDLTAFEGVPADEFLDGTVVKVVPFGAFVTATAPDGSTAGGLVHISNIREGFVDSIDDEVSVGQNVKVKVLGTENGKLSLSMKDGGEGGGGGFSPREPVDLTAFQDVAEDQWLDGKVARIAPFGAFVTVTLPDGGASADGLVHITQIRDGFIESVEDELQQGQDVKVRVVSVDMAEGKLGLTMKSPGEVES